MDVSEDEDEETGFFGAKKTKKKKQVTIVAEENFSPSKRDRSGSQPMKSALIPRSLDAGLGKARSRSRSQKSVSLNREITRHRSSPHREIYEAKYEKYLTNKR